MKEDNEFHIVDSIINHLKKILNCCNRDCQLGIDNATIVSTGRNDEEKEQLRAMCEEEDLYEKRLSDLRKSNLKPQDWLNKFIDEQLDASCDSITADAKDLVKQTIIDETGMSIEAQADSLDEEMEQTLNIAKGIIDEESI